jgi:hypothetical protein
MLATLSNLLTLLHEPSETLSSVGWPNSLKGSTLGLEGSEHFLSSESHCFSRHGELLENT